ncbi:Dps family protein [Streptomyces nodosus]|uniref:DNA starvation/stationary phase protection protein n=1 Tax=Streptomyces nodosus TaxID=40318 RepID=A0A0B5DEP4_9ACTN|nr:DNA starvation/stationary phase protection protein [Streptomyces nodosus]AJE41649.1 ferritin [Streptomyces nodosus]MBB4792860.1 starvation-inducible DNA-binding protein [Streptomyces nodosus]QEV40184.1 DNA starvation/stationary phase protection protein [Streptomyces nodosus]
MTASPGGSRRSETGVTRFTASPQLARALQQILVDLVELHLQGKQAHWNVVGHNFRDLHLQLDEIVDDARESADVIAERMRALDKWPDGRSDTVTASTTLPPFPEGELSVSAVVDLVTTRLYATVDTVRTHHDQVDGEDPSTADLLHGIIVTLEKHAWMVGAENRTP